MINDNIEGVEITELKIISDHRGSVMHMLRNDSKVFEKFTWQKYFSSLPKYPIDYKSAEERDLLVSRSSILNLIRNDENPVSATPVQLNEHFRSLPMLAEFTSDQFYKDDTQDAGLKIMTALPEKKQSMLFVRFKYLQKEKMHLVH